MTCALPAKNLNETTICAGLAAMVIWIKCPVPQANASEALKTKIQLGHCPHNATIDCHVKHNFLNARRF
jgi:hypothetical protein